MNEIENLSRKSARPATIAIKNQKHTMSLTTVSTEGGMHNEVLLIVLKSLYKNLLYKCMKK